MSLGTFDYENLEQHLFPAADKTHLTEIKFWSKSFSNSFEKKSFQSFAIVFKEKVLC